MSAQRPSVAVIGAGAVGLCCALALARRGARVFVLEQTASLSGYGQHSASVRGAGMLGAFSETLHEPALVHPDALALRAAGLARWREAASSAVRFDGVLHAAATEAHLARLQALVESARRHGARAQLLSADGVAQAEPLLRAQDCIGGALIEDEGQVVPRDQLRQWADDCAGAGATLLGAGVTAVERAGRNWTVRAQNTVVPVDEIVIAAGAAAGAALHDVAPSLARLGVAHGCRIAVAPRLHFTRTMRFEDVYIAQTASCSMIGGGMLSGDVNPHARAALQKRLWQAARHAAPIAFETAPPLDQCDTQFGVRPMSPDASPMIGRDPAHGALVAIGHSRNGWLLAPLTGAMIAAHVLGDDLPALWLRFTPDRFSAERA